MSVQKLETLKVTTDPVVLEVATEPFVIYTYRGYAPAVNVRTDAGEERTLYISPKSLAEGLELLRQRNGELFSGIKMRVSRESTDKFAKYVVEGLFD